MSLVKPFLKNKKITFDISLTKNCNFRCSYCYGKEGLKNNKMTPENVNKMIKFIKTIQERYYDLNEWRTQLNIYGGEPLLTLDEIEYLARKMNKYSFVIVTNGSLIDKKFEQIYRIWNMYHNIRFNVSYDYCMQNETRQEGTYNLVRNNILLLNQSDIYVHTISTFTAKNITRFLDVIRDWNNLRMRTKYGLLKFCYNIDDNLVSDDVPINESEIRRVFESTRNYIELNGIDKSQIIYNSGYGTKQDIKTAKELSSDVVKHICAINEDGQIYTGIRILFLPDEVRIADKYGTLDDDVDTILDNKDRILNIIKEAKATGSEKCAKCENICKPLLARTITVSNGSIVEANKKYSDTWCKIHDLLHEYDLQ